MKRLFLLAVVLCILFAGAAPGTAQTIPAALRVNGVSVERINGDRFVFAGANVEMYRDYRLGQGMGAACNYASDGFYTVRASMADRLAGLGVNAIRLNYAYKNLDATNLARFLDVAQAFIERGLYVMPTDHTYTGAGLTAASASYPMMLKIIQGLRDRGVDLDYLIYNPFNEPGPDITPAAWELAQQKVIAYLRGNAQFDGLIVLDGTGWATALDVDTFNKVIKYDSDKRTALYRAAGGDVGTVLPGKVIFSNHLYPNIGFGGLPTEIGKQSAAVPLTVGELGQYNETPLNPGYVKQVITAALKAGDGWIAKGHNGLWAWIVNWCDDNKQLNDWKVNPGVPYSIDEAFTSYGNIWNTAYYAGFKGGVVQPPPRATSLPTNTPRPPSATPRPPTVTAPPVVIITNTPGPTSTPAGPTPTPCPRKFHISGKVGGADVDLWVEDCAA